MPSAAAADAKTPAPKPNRRPTGKRLLVVLGLAVIGGGSYGLWKFVEPYVKVKEQYRFAARDINVTPSPPWIHSDVKAESLKQAGIDEQLSVLESGLAERVATAFKLHPWVKKVVRVVKRPPAGVEVEIEYRQPVCMVEVPGGLFPVDEQGVLLPTADFTTDEAVHYPRLSNIQTVTEGPTGTVWQDARVIGAAKISGLLLADWEPLKLYRIMPVAASASAPVEYELYTHGQTRVLWGHAEPNSAAGEPTSEDKLAQLKKYATHRDGLDRAAGPQDIDVRRPGDLVATPRTASLPAEDSPAKQ
jgi:hypothetical protein